jgi:hypothetical protein
LYEWIQGHNIVAFPDVNIGLAVSRAIAVETSRGGRIAKDKQGHKIDAVIALAMAAHAAVQGQNDRGYSIWGPWMDTDDKPPQTPSIPRAECGTERRSSNRLCDAN